LNPSDIVDLKNRNITYLGTENVFTVLLIGLQFCMSNV
jgi:hypothetical protein